MGLLQHLLKESLSQQDVFTFTPEEALKFKELFDEFGVNLDTITVDELTEASVVGMGDTERFDKGLAIRIDRGTHNKLRDMINIGMDAKDWYYEISDNVFSALGESDGCLFLMLLSSTSPRNMLTKNFAEASILYEGFKKDLQDNEQLVYKFLADDFKATDFMYDEGSEYYGLELVQAMERNGMSDLGAKINNIKKTFSLYIEGEGNLSRIQTSNFIANRFNPYSKTIKGIIDFDGNILRKSKVYNFTMNLLNPDHSVDMRNKKWYFVTIDSWMIRAMYPYLPDKEQQKIMSHNAKYLYAQEKIINFANEVGLYPHQVQASIWVAKLLEAGKSVDSFSKSIDRKKRELESANNELSIIDGDLKSIISEIYQQNTIKPTNSEKLDIPDNAPF